MNLIDRLLHRRKDEVVSDNTWLVVGLGNPGTQYGGNRHNVGHMVVDEIATRIGVSQMQVSRLIRQSLARLRMDIERSPERRRRSA